MRASDHKLCAPLWFAGNKDGENIYGSGTNCTEKLCTLR